MVTSSSSDSSTVGEKTSSASIIVSPYTLSSNDNPGALITSVLLTGDNYNEWSTEMLNALQAKRKMGFINGTIKKPPPESAKYKNWMTVNSMIIGWIRVSIEPKVRSTVTFIADTSQLWIDLKQRFSVHNKVRLHQLKGQIAACRQDGQTVLDYFGKLSSLWEEYTLHIPVPACTCGVADTLAKEREEDKVHDFLLGR